MEVLIGGVSAVTAGIFSNPMEVVKTRMQLQGELQAKGQYAKHYKNAFHAMYSIGKNEGLRALQKGLVPALWFQFFMNGARLGTYHMAEERGWTKKNGSETAPLKALFAGALTGTLGAVAGSPFYLVKTHLQARTTHQTIAVGHQHDYKSMTEGFRFIYNTQGIKGLWRGSTSSIPRITVASAVQMLTFETGLDFVRGLHLFNRDSWIPAFTASLMSGIWVTLAMAPFDLVSTRFYNQGVNARGKGVLYKSLTDCVRKVYAEEGLLGFYKGWTASYFRLGPHSLLMLVLWDRLKRLYAGL